MKELKHKFWTSEDEMITELEEEFMYEVIYVDYENLEVVTPEEETKVFDLIRANNTITIKF